MATIPSYEYIPIYGVEEYDALEVPSSAQLGGGAKETNENLLATLWTNLQFDALVLPSGGNLVKPIYAFGGDWVAQTLGPQPPGQNVFDFPNVGAKSNMRSRYSARFLLDPQGKADVDLPVLAFLKPPLELRQALVNAFSLDEDGNVVYKRSNLDGLTWNLYASESDSEGEGGPVVDVNHSFSSFFNENVPYYAGDGSDGVFPTRFPIFDEVIASGSAGMQTFIDALRTGNFSVAAILDPAVTSGVLYTIEWPHSIGRG